MKKAIAKRSRWKRNSRLARLGARIGLAHNGGGSLGPSGTATGAQPAVT